jgi:hypothetical protein
MPTMQMLFNLQFVKLTHFVITISLNCIMEMLSHQEPVHETRDIDDISLMDKKPGAVKKHPLITEKQIY